VSWPQTYSPAGLRFPLLSIADLPAVTPVARSAAPASPAIFRQLKRGSSVRSKGPVPKLPARRARCRRGRRSRELCMFDFLGVADSDCPIRTLAPSLLPLSKCEGRPRCGG